ncbi:Hypothetical predicted protein [Lecanosticta acicola]|uniref:Uncharacterized protein n=1 Tax=Lecanosticta acicola TaxID=111012 RepID=A0AAI8Z9G0_9PEZI|nr:Hypothetical predicted protein [Lecanosticta acicola]
MKLARLVLALLGLLASISTTAEPHPGHQVSKGGILQPRDLVANQHHTFNAYHEISKYAKVTKIWSDSLRPLQKHFLYDTIQKQAFQKANSDIAFSHLAHGTLMLDAFLSLTQQSALLRSKSQDAFRHVIEGALTPVQLRQTKCYCEEFKSGWFYPPEEMINAFLDLGRNQSFAYLQSIDSAKEFLSGLRQFDVLLQEVEETIALEEPPAPTTRSTKRAVKKLHKQLRKSLSIAAFDDTQLHLTAQIIRSRHSNLTVLARMNTSFDRALASIDLACAMARNDGKTSLAHLTQYGRAKIGFCPGEGSWQGEL